MSKGIFFASSSVVGWWRLLNLLEWGSLAGIDWSPIPLSELGVEEVLCELVCVVQEELATEDIHGLSNEEAGVCVVSVCARFRQKSPHQQARNRASTRIHWENLTDLDCVVDKGKCKMKRR